MKIARNSTKAKNETKKKKKKTRIVINATGKKWENKCFADILRGR